MSIPVSECSGVIIEDAPLCSLSVEADGSLVTSECQSQQRVTPTRARPHACSFSGCSKSFRTASDLSRHKRTHTGCKPYQCSFTGCGRRFSTKDIRKVHMRQHTGERPYVCHVVECGRSFTSQTNYKNHLRTHTGERPFVCAVQSCGKRFAEYSTLRKHEVVHSASSIQCAHCPRRFRQTSTHLRHMRREHSWALSASVQEVTDPGDLQDVERVASHPQQECTVSSSDKLALIVGRLDVSELQNEPESVDHGTQLFILPTSDTQVVDDISLLNCAHTLVIESSDLELDSESTLVIHPYSSDHPP